MRKGFIALAGCLAALPVAAVVTFLLTPLWGWFEAKTGVESLGHSGPATWCFGAVYLAVLAVGVGSWRVFRGQR